MTTPTGYLVDDVVRAFDAVGEAAGGGIGVRAGDVPVPAAFDDGVGVGMTTGVLLSCCASPGKTSPSPFLL